MPGPRVARAERAALVGLITGRARRLEAERSLDELAGLADAAGAQVVLRVLQERPKPDSSTYLGSGKIATLALTPRQTQTLALARRLGTISLSLRSLNDAQKTGSDEDNGDLGRREPDHEAR